MLDDERFRIGRMDELLDLARREGLTPFDRAAIHGAAWAIADALLSRIENASGFDRAYAREKLRGWRNHLAAAVGFDDALGHSVQLHWSWASGEMQSFRSTVLPPE